MFNSSKNYNRSAIFDLPKTLHNPHQHLQDVTVNTHELMPEQHGRSAWREITAVMQLQSQQRESDGSACNVIYMGNSANNEYVTLISTVSKMLW